MGLRQVIAGRWGTSESNYDDVELDPVTNALVAIQYPHHEIHEGDNFLLCYSVADLGAETGDIMSLTFTTPDTTKWPHFVFSAMGTSGWRVRLIEAPSGGGASPGGSITILNSNRNSDTTSGLLDLSSVANKVSYGATLATGGTTLWDQYIEGPTVGQGGSGVITGRHELMLKQNTKYQLSMYGTDAAAGTLIMDWYEHTSKH